MNFFILDYKRIPRMKKVWIFIFITGICSAIMARQPHHVRYVEPEKTGQIHLKKLFEAGLYDSAIRYCAAARIKESMSYDELEQALANACWYKGDKHTAYQYVLNHTDYALKTYNGEHAFSSMLYDYDFSYPLATDSFLDKIIRDKVSDYYLKLDFPDAAAGLKLILLDYQLQKQGGKYSYEIRNTPDPAQKKILHDLGTEQSARLTEQFLDLLQQHGKLFTWKEAGTGYNAQYSYIRYADDSLLHLQLQPYFERSFLEKEISPETYVHERISVARLREKETIKLDRLYDSLCQVYHCAEPSLRTIRMAHGDSVLILRD